MSKQLKVIKDTKELLENLGVKVDRAEHGGKHFKFYCQYLGVKQLFVRSLSPSDGRGTKNFKQDVLKWMRYCDERN